MTTRSLRLTAGVAEPARVACRRRCENIRKQSSAPTSFFRCAPPSPARTPLTQSRLVAEPRPRHRRRRCTVHVTPRATAGRRRDPAVQGCGGRLRGKCARGVQSAPPAEARRRAQGPLRNFGCARRADRVRPLPDRPPTVTTTATATARGSDACM